MSYKITYYIEGEPGVGHCLGPMEFTDPMDVVAEVNDLIRAEQVISVTIHTGTKLSPAPIFNPVKLLR